MGTDLIKCGDIIDIIDSNVFAAEIDLNLGSYIVDDIWEYNDGFGIIFELKLQVPSTGASQYLVLSETELIQLLDKISPFNHIRSI